MLLNDEEAATSYNKLLEESHSNRDYAQKNTTSWRDDETHLLQWSIFTYALQKSKNIEDFDEVDWTNIAEFIPTRDKIKCLKRWLFIQKLGGNKTHWSKQEDLALR